MLNNSCKCKVIIRVKTDWTIYESVKLKRRFFSF